MKEVTIFIGIYLFSYALDLCLGDPRWLSHPVIWIGKYISCFERMFYPKEEGAIWRKRILGALLSLSTMALTFALSLLLSIGGLLPICFFLYTTLATKSLAQEGKKVATILASGDMDLARKELSYLVSRDTKELSKEKMIMTTIETISENTVDGVISPMFYAFVGSCLHLTCFGKELSLALPLAMTYKAINTLDSMVGYKNTRYMDFGKVSARIDDVANWLPARLTGFLFVPLAALFLKMHVKDSLRIFFFETVTNMAVPMQGKANRVMQGL